MREPSTASPWLGRYSEPLPIRARGAFQLVSTRRSTDGTACVVLVPDRATPNARAKKVLWEVERTHGLIGDPRIPRVAFSALDSETPFLEFECDAVADGDELLRILADSGEKLAYEQADALITSVRVAMQAAHAVVDPVRGAPICLGSLALGNILFSRAGRIFVVGFGSNFVLESRGGGMNGAPLFQALEVSAGADPAPTSDYVALLLMTRFLIPYAEMAPTVARIFGGEVRPTDLELVELIRWFDHRVVSESVTARASIEEAVAKSERVREILNVTLDFDGLALRVAGLLEAYGEAVSVTALRPGGVLVTVGPDAAWIAGAEGVRQRLGRAHRRILQALVARFVEKPGAYLTLTELLEAGWPGEQPLFEAGANRVYVAINRLRALGLRDVLERFDDGWRLAPSTILERAD